MAKKTANQNGGNGNTENAYSSESLNRMLSEAKIGSHEPLQEPQVCVKIVNGDKTSIVGTHGNFSVIIGKPKSRKTFFVSLLVGIIMRGVNFVGKIQGSLPDGQRRILYFDTEQGRHHVSKVVNRIKSIAGQNVDCENLESYGLRKYNAEERQMLIEHAINNSSNVGLVIIDGLRDLITAINNEEEASNLCDKLLKWSQEKNIHIIGVLHENKNDSSPRGHIGSELQNKAESVICVSKIAGSDNTSKVTPRFTREIEFDTLHFEINGEGIPVELNEPIEGEVHIRTNPQDFGLEFHQDVLTRAFGDKRALGYDSMWRNLKTALAEERLHVGTNKAKEFLVYYQQMENPLILKQNRSYLRSNG